MADKNILDNLSGQEIKEMIDVGKITLESLGTAALRKLMDYELDMLCIGKGDAELICKCSELLDKTDPDPMTSEAFMNIIEKSKREHITVIDEATERNSMPKKRFILKRTALVAAAVLILMTSTAAIAGALGFDIYKYISEIVREPEGTEINVDEFTFYHNGEVKQYASVEEMIENENLDIMYPARLPDGVRINKIYLTTEINGNRIIQIITNDVNVNYNIEFSNAPIESYSQEIIEYQGIEFHIKHEEPYSASFLYKNNKYCISATTKEDLILIIENLREKQP